MKQHWIVVADAAVARIFSSNGKVENATVVESYDNPDAHKMEQELVTDRPGTKSDGHGGIRHGMAEPTSHKEVLIREFARKLSRTLTDAHRAQRFERLTLVAPPAFLGMLRSELKPETAKTIQHEFHKDLTKVSASDVGAHISRLIG